MKTIFNQATLSYQGTVTTSNITRGELRTVLSATKTAVVDRYRRESTIVYLVTMINSSPDDALDNLTLTDNLGEFTEGGITVVPLSYTEGSVRYFSNGDPLPAPTVTSVKPLTVTGLSVPKNGNATLVYEVAVNEFAPLGIAASIVNRALITGTGLGADTEVSETIVALNEPVLTVYKEMNPTVISENDRITYTFTVRNTGNTATAAADNVRLTDTFDPILSDLAVRYGTTDWVEGTDYTYNRTTGLFTTLLNKISVDAADFSRDPATGAVSVLPGIAVITVSGTV